MISGTRTRPLLLGSALTLSLAGMASAQTQAQNQGQTEVQIRQEAIASLAAECQDLVERLEVDGNMVPGDQADRVMSALNDNDVELCVTVVADLDAAAQAGTAEAEAQAGVTATDTDSATATDTETEQVTESVTMQTEAVVEGAARVVVPEPEVDVQVPPPEVTVREQSPSVSVAQGADSIEVQQEQPRVAVQIPEIIVQVDIPAPSIFVRTSNPDVQVSQNDPQVEVVQGEPQVSVRQPEPELDVDLDVAEDESGNELVPGQVQESAEASEGAQTVVEGEVETADTQPRVNIVQPEGEPDVTFEEARPEITYQGAEPQVTVEFAQQPTVRISQTGAPTVTFETDEQRQERREASAAQPQQTQGEEQTAGAEMAQDEEADVDAAVGVIAADIDTEMNAEQEATDETMTADSSAGMQGQRVTVADVLAMEVVGADGDELGNPEALIEHGDSFAIVVSAGGFLGLGQTEVAIPLERVSMVNGQLVLSNMTEEQISDAQSIDYQNGVELAPEDQVMIQ